MGGVVTRAFLLKYRDVARKIRLLYFFATPTNGSPYASLARLFSKNPQFKQLYPMEADNYLGMLQSNWLAANLGLKSYCAYEKLPLYGQIIVDLQSASSLCTQRLDPIDADHVTIVKPVDENSNSYRALKAAFSETVPTKPARQTSSRRGAPITPKLVSEELTITKPKNGATGVPLDPPIEFSYVNVPDHQHLWLIVVGYEPHESDPNLYWPIGYLPPFGEGHSVVLDGEISHSDPKPKTWRSKFPARNAWFNDAGKRYLLELIAVDDTDDEDLGRAYKEEVERGGPEKKYPGVKKDEHDYESFAKARAKSVHVTRGQ